MQTYSSQAHKTYYFLYIFTGSTISLSFAAIS